MSFKTLRNVSSNAVRTIQGVLDFVFPNHYNWVVILPQWATNTQISHAYIYDIQIILHRKKIWTLKSSGYWHALVIKQILEH